MLFDANRDVLIIIGWNHEMKFHSATSQIYLCRKVARQFSSHLWIFTVSKIFCQLLLREVCESNRIDIHFRIRICECSSVSVKLIFSPFHDRFPALLHYSIWSYLCERGRQNEWKDINWLQSAHFSIVKHICILAHSLTHSLNSKWKLAMLLSQPNIDKSYLWSWCCL